MQTESPTPTQFLDIPLASLHESKWNPRKHYDDAKLQELADSIRGKGVIEPFVVSFYGTQNLSSIREPLRTLTTRERPPMDELQVTCLRQELELLRMRIEALRYELEGPKSTIPAFYVAKFERLMVRHGLISQESR